MKKRSVFISFTLLCLLIAACATSTLFVPYPVVLEKSLRKFESGEIDEATKRLEKLSGEEQNRVLYKLEQGMLYHIVGDFESSIASLAQAEKTAIDYEKKPIISLTDTGASLSTAFTNDNAIPYRGYGYERVMLNTVLALNYLFLGKVEDAAVEVRRADLQQKRQLERHREEMLRAKEARKKEKIDPGSDDKVLQRYREMGAHYENVANSFMNAFTYYISGVIYELYGQPNDAYIDYKKAYELQPDLSFLRRDLLRLSRRLGFHQEHQQWLDAFGGVGFTAPTDVGELIVIYQCEDIPAKKEVRMDFFVGNSWVSMAMPIYDVFYFPGYYLKVESEGRMLGETEIVVDLYPLAVKCLEEQAPIIAVRQILRLITKSTMSAIASEYDRRRQGCPVASICTSMYNVISENADLRSWLTLPHNIQIYRGYLKPGQTQLDLRVFIDSRFISSRRVTIDVQTGKTSLVNLRSCYGKMFVQTVTL